MVVSTVGLEGPAPISISGGAVLDAMIRRLLKVSEGGDPRLQNAGVGRTNGELWRAEGEVSGCTSL